MGAQVRDEGSSTELVVAISRILKEFLLAICTTLAADRDGILGPVDSETIIFSQNAPSKMVRETHIFSKFSLMSSLK